MKNIYFISDAHLGSRALEHRRQQERRLVRFLDEIKDKAEAIYMLGDIFDFWYEYKTVVPRGFTRFLGKVSELTDAGIEVHFFTGNHDIWAYGYLEEECGMTIHRAPETISLADKTFYLAHGDGLGDHDRKFLFLRSVFHNRVCQWLFSKVHPSWGLTLGLNWAKRNRLRHAAKAPNGEGGDPGYRGEANEPLVRYAKEYLASHPDVNYFLFGHRHIELDLMLTHSSRMLILGDWITQCTYAVFDGQQLYLENYVEGETEP